MKLDVLKYKLHVSRNNHFIFIRATGEGGDFHEFYVMSMPEGEPVISSPKIIQSMRMRNSLRANELKSLYRAIFFANATNITGIPETGIQLRPITSIAE